MWTVPSGLIWSIVISLNDEAPMPSHRRYLERHHQYHVT
jgi:hypothetical protein